MKKYKKGFTLAEALSVLVIIGIIAMLTVPSLKSNIDDKKFSLMFDKNLSTFSGALYDYNGDLDDIKNNVDDFEDKFLQNYFMVISEIENTDLKNAYPDGEYYSYSNIIGNKTYILQEGTDFVCFKNTDDRKIGNDSTLRQREIKDDNGNTTGFERYTKEHTVKIICVLDTNGKKGPNETGKDRRIILLADEKASGLDEEAEEN